MPLIGIYPRTSETEDALAAGIALIRDRITAVVTRIWDVPDHDVIVTLHTCTVRDPDPRGSEIVVLLDTNPNFSMEQRANDLRDAVAMVFRDLDLIGEGENLEVWVRFLPGSWCLFTSSIHGIFMDRVDHPVKHETEPL